MLPRVTAEDPPRMWPLALITSLFFLWGMANNLNDILIQQFTKAFSLSNFTAGLVQTAVNVGYFCAALPAAMLAKRSTYKHTITAGLALYAFGAGLFVPAAQWRSYPLFLVALFVIGCGLSCLETAANPYIAALGPPETATRRLNFAQAWNPLGSLTGILVGRKFIFDGVELQAHSCKAICARQKAVAEAAAQPAPGCSDWWPQPYTTAQEVWAPHEKHCFLGPPESPGTPWPALSNVCSSNEIYNFEHTAARAVQMPYLLISILVLGVALMICATALPNVSKLPSISAGGGVAESVGRLLRVDHWRQGVLAQFANVGAQIGCWSFLIRYVGERSNFPPRSHRRAVTTMASAQFLGTLFSLWRGLARDTGEYSWHVLLGRRSDHRVRRLGRPRGQHSWRGRAARRRPSLLRAQRSASRSLLLGGTSARDGGRVAHRASAAGALCADELR